MLHFNLAMQNFNNLKIEIAEISIYGKYKRVERFSIITQLGLTIRSRCGGTYFSALLVSYI